MDAARTSDEPRAGRDARIDSLRAEASAAVASTANTLRAVGQRYREAYADELARWQALRDELDTVERGRPDPGSRLRALPDPVAQDDPAAAAAESRADAARVRELRAEVEALGLELGHQQTELAKMEIALRNLESTWLFLERGDSSLVSEASEGLPTDVQMRIVEAQESERSRLAQEVHAGPGPVERDLPGRVHRACHRERRPDGPHGAPLPSGPPPPRARLRADVHQPAPTARP
jgi:signal transduction histidine kinase